MRAVWVVRAWWFFALFVSASLCYGEIQRVELKIETDSRYLPYGVEIVNSFGEDCCQFSISHSRRVVTVRHNEDRFGSLAYARNPCSDQNGNSHFLISAYPGGMILDEKSVKDLAISDIAVAIDSTDRDTSIIGTGFWHDSAFVFKWSPKSNTVQKLFAATGVDRGGNGIWGGEFVHILTADCNLDGHVELLFYLNPERDMSPRLLVCVQGSPFRIRWILPIASLVQHALPCNDSAGAGIILSTHNPGQGGRDSLFDDAFAYLVRVDGQGKVLFTRVISHYAYGTMLIQSRQAGSYFLLHGVPIRADTTGVKEIPLKTIVTKVNSMGEVIFHYEDSVLYGGIWTGDWEGDGIEDVYLQLRSDLIKVLDTLLVPKAEVSVGSALGWQATISNFDSGKEVFVLVDGNGLIGLFSENLQKLAELPPASYLEVLERGSEGEVRALVGAINAKTFVAEITRRDAWTYIAIFYRSNQVYVLATLFAALSALLVSNYYRRRTKQNLTIINSQKSELEQTHEALKQAQQIIVAQEKYRQAKDIAGGFAHEIRNALFPADSAITVLHEKAESGPVPKETIEKFLGNVHSSIARAVRITNLITQYTRLDAQHGPEKVDLAHAVTEAVKENQPLIDRLKVQTVLRGPGDLFIEGNRVQLASVLTNLLLNALEALTNRTNPTILMEWQATGDRITLTVSDNGSGIAAEALPRVFDTFFSTKPNRGTGLGLSITRKIVEMYGGSITVSSEQNKGTAFELTFKRFVD